MALTLAPTAPDEYKALKRLSQRYFGEECLGMETYEAFLSFIQCPYSCWSLKQEERIIGSFSIFRMCDTLLQDVLACHMQEQDITSADLLPLEQGTPMKLYLAAGAVDDLLPANLRSYYAGRLIAGFTSVLLSLREQGYVVEEIYSIAVSEEGKRAGAKLGFEPLFIASCPANITPMRLLVDQQRLRQWHRLRGVAPSMRLPILIS
jgi:hypothetical protein